MKTLHAVLTIVSRILFVVFGGVLSGAITYLVIWYFHFDGTLLPQESGASVIAVANTYIVFTTLIFVLFTFVLTGIGIYLAWQFSKTRNQEIRNSMQDFFRSLEKDNDLARKFVKELFDNNVVFDKLRDLINERVERKVDEFISGIKDNADFKNHLSNDEVTK